MHLRVLHYGEVMYEVPKPLFRLDLRRHWIITIIILDCLAPGMDSSQPRLEASQNTFAAAVE